MDMHMRNFETGDDQPDAGWLEGKHLRRSNGSGHPVNMIVCRFLEIEPMIDFGAWYDQRVARSERVDREKSYAAFVAPDETTGEISGDDAGKDTGHHLTLLRWLDRPSRLPSGGL